MLTALEIIFLSPPEDGYTFTTPEVPITFDLNKPSLRDNVSSIWIHIPGISRIGYRDNISFPFTDNFLVPNSYGQAFTAKVEVSLEGTNDADGWAKAETSFHVDAPNNDGTVGCPDCFIYFYLPFG